MVLSLSLWIVQVFGSPKAELSLSRFIQEINGPRKTVLWDNLTYTHEIHDESLAQSVQHLSQLALFDPKVFKTEWNSLSPDQKEILISDNPDKMNEAFDVLSAGMREPIDDQLKAKYPNIVLERNEIMSIAKSRLRRLIGKESAADSRVFVARARGPHSQIGVAVCSEENLRYFAIDLTEKSESNFICGSKSYLIQKKKVSLRESSYQELQIGLPSKFPYPLKNEIYAIATVGMLGNIKSAHQDFASLLLEYWRGYQLDSIDDVTLVEQLPLALSQAQVLIVASPWASTHDGIRFFKSSGRGKRLRYSREFRVNGLQKRRVILDVFVPIDDRAATSDLQISFSDLRKIYAKKESPTFIIEYSDFSAKHIGRWLEIQRTALQSLFVATTNKAHRGQRTIDILPPVDLMASLLANLGRGKSLQEISRQLEAGPRMVSNLINAYRVLNNLDEVEFGFSPITNWQKEVVDFIQAPNKFVWVLKSNSGEREIPPEPVF